ncbi:amidohydrolase family protein [Dankookia sp. GCM10030260]|uniref:N-acyl-D-amino-acid deacylase family protein n=1 Tax=Dankookia sp. GCM10030260 TaxID=3273390 RepID=UPI0036079399
MHDIVFRDALIVDGTGAAPFAGDLAVEGDRIVQAGGKAAAGRREVRAGGRLVTPGWVDIHTHYDGQATWDPVLRPSSNHGVTTVIFGNCGVGFAPARREHHQALIDLMEGVEEVPGVVFTEGLRWDWESFGEYLDTLGRMPRTVDVGTQLAHHPLRVYVMGERAIRREAATAEDIAAMERLAAEALRAGAFGITTSRTDQHMTRAGEQVPGRYSDHAELMGLARALRTAGRGALGLNADFEDVDAEFAWMRDFARTSGRPLYFLHFDRAHDRARLPRITAAIRAARAEGLALTGQVGGRPAGLLLGLSTDLNPFILRESFAELATLPLPQRLARLRDPATRARILAEEASPRLLRLLPPLSRFIATRWEGMFVLGEPPDYEPTAERSVAAMAARAGQTPQDYCYDYLTAGDGGRMLFFPLANYATGDHAVIRDLLCDPHTVFGLSDGGAHCGSICDGAIPTFMLTHWVRDRARGPRLPLEFVVKRMTGETADFMGLSDRGRLAPGLKADLNLIDLAGLRAHHPEMIADLPAGGRRLIQRVEGYGMTMVSGLPVFEEGEETGARPGVLLRAG